MFKKKDNDTYQEQTEVKKTVEWKKIAKMLLFPHTFVVFILFNLCAVGLAYIFWNHWEESIPAILFYVIAFYTLVIVCVRIPRIVKWVKMRADSNEHIHTYLTDKDLRMRESLYRGLLINTGFAVFKVVMGFVYDSPWLFAMAGYNQANLWTAYPLPPLLV